MPFDTIGAPYVPKAVTPGFPALAPITTHRVGPGPGSFGVVTAQGGATGTAASNVVFTGTPAIGQTVTVTLTIPNPSAPGNAAGGSQSVLANAGLPVSILYNVLATDTTTTIATAIKTAINANTLLSSLVTATSSTNTLTITAASAGVTYPLAVAVTGADATNTVTVGGTFGAGRALSITITPVNGAAIVVNYTTVAGDSTATALGASLATAINNSLAVQGGANNSPVIQPAVSALGVITLLALVPGASQNSIQLAAAGAGGTTLTAGNANFTGGGSVLVATPSAADLDLTSTVDPNATFSYAQAGTQGAVTFYKGMPTDVDAATKADLRAQGLV